MTKPYETHRIWEYRTVKPCQTQVMDSRAEMDWSKDLSSKSLESWDVGSEKMKNTCV